MQSTRFLVLLFWASGRRTAYCARAYDPDGAIQAAIDTTQGDPADLTTREAYPWDPALGGPGAPKDAGRAYKLRSRDFVDRTLTNLGQPRGTLAREPLAPEAPEACGGEGPGLAGHERERAA